MSKLEELQPKAALRGILPDALVAVISTQWFGTEALGMTAAIPTTPADTLRPVPQGRAL